MSHSEPGGASHLCRAFLRLKAALSRRRNKLLGCTAERCCTPKPVGGTGAYPQREASWSAARQRRFDPGYKTCSTKVGCAPERFSHWGFVILSSLVLGH